MRYRVYLTRRALEEVRSLPRRSGREWRGDRGAVLKPPA